MKCIIRQYGLGGGAPRSILQHIKALKQLSYDDIECMTRNTDSQLLAEFEKEVNQVITRISPAEFCFSRKYISAFKEYLWEYRYIKDHKPDLAIALGQLNGVLYTNICKKLGVPLIIYIAGGEIKQHDACIGLWHDCETICFSIENADFITRQFSENHTNVISNRIDIKERFCDIDSHYMTSNNEVNVLIVSRLDPRKIESVYSLLNVLTKCATNDLRINVRIAGKGSYEEELKKFCEQKQTDNLKIEMLGQVHNLTEQFRWAHIVAGKGRSVIEPIMMNRIGCIIGEDGKMEFCKQESFENLYHYNFSGRKLKNEAPYTEVYEMLTKIKNGQISDEFIMNTADMTIQQYSKEFLPDKLRRVLDKIPPKVNPDQHASILFHFIRVVAKYVLYEILYKKEWRNNV